MPGPAVRIAIIVIVGAVVLAMAQRARSDRSAMEITPEERAATLEFAPEVAPGDRQWILAALGGARPEARRLIDEIDGFVLIRTDLAEEGAIGLAETGPGGATISLDIGALDGERAMDRAVVVLHEFGHVVDAALMDEELRTQLDAGIPTIGTCEGWTAEPTGACTAREERFADTFAKWALGGRFSLAGSGYGIPAPASIEDWGRPLGLLAAELDIRARG